MSILFDIVEAVLLNKALDMVQGSSIQAADAVSAAAASCRGGQGRRAVVIITAGVPRRPGAELATGLIGINAKVAGARSAL